VLKADKELMTIPVIGAAVAGVVAIVVGIVVYATLETSTNAAGETTTSANPAAVVLGILGLLIVAVVTQVFAGALVAGANERFEGGNPTLGSSFSKAMTRFGSIVGWTATNATVGVILSAVREKAGFLGDIVVSIIGAAWNIVTWLVMPVIIVEGIGPLAATKRSAVLIKSKWGENLIAQGGLGLFGLLIILPGVIVGMAISSVLPIVGIPLLVLYLAIAFTVLSALGAIFRTALYRFSAGLPVGNAFSESMLVGTFGAKGTGR
jgi:hypothetical protein